MPHSRPASIHGAGSVQLSPCGPNRARISAVTLSKSLKVAILVEQTPFFFPP